MSRVLNLNPSAERLEAVRIKWPTKGRRFLRIEFMRFVPHPGIAGAR